MTDERGWTVGGEPMFEIGTYVRSKGEIGAFEADRLPVRRTFAMARVTKAEGNKIYIQPGSFHMGRWRGIRWSFTVHGEDLRPVEGDSQ